MSHSKPITEQHIVNEINKINKSTDIHNNNICNVRSNKSSVNKNTIKNNNINKSHQRTFSQGG